SCWRDEEAVQRWRNNERHRQVQKAGREYIFAQYRLRVVQILRDYGMHDRTEAPQDSRQTHSSVSDSCSLNGE
ncbi:MAG TPA: hypothetical protein VH327_04270, partial [Gammaproteobacteria bacterium]|nr:hypothetical protein [Gammaproteobacteria bacterium]